MNKKVFIVMMILVNITSLFGYSFAEQINTDVFKKPPGFPTMIDDGVKYANRYVADLLPSKYDNSKDGNLFQNEISIKKGGILQTPIPLNNQCNTSSPRPDDVQPNEYVNDIMDILIGNSKFGEQQGARFLITYGYPKKYDASVGRYQYLGKSVYGPYISSYKWPNDGEDDKRAVEEKEWEYKPWKNSELFPKYAMAEGTPSPGITSLSTPNAFSRYNPGCDIAKEAFNFCNDQNNLDIYKNDAYKARMEKIIRKGIADKIIEVASMHALDPAHYDIYFWSRDKGYLNPETFDKENGDDPYYWFDRTYILLPPTKFNFGIGVLFHKFNGVWQYVTIPLHPDNVCEITTEIIGLPETPVYLANKAVNGGNITIDNLLFQTNLITNYTFGDRSKGADIDYGWVKKFSCTLSVTNTSNNQKLMNDIKTSEISKADKDTIFRDGKIVSDAVDLVVDYDKLNDGENKILLRATGELEIDDEHKDVDGNKDHTPIKLEVTSDKYITIVKGVVKTKTYTLKYDELSMKISHEIMSNPIKAKLSLPSNTTDKEYFWDGDTKGSLNVKVETGKTFLEPYQINNIDPFKSTDEEVFRSPNVSFRIDRGNFNDNPKDPWLKNFSNPVYKTAISYGGYIQRPYAWNQYEVVGSKEVTNLDSTKTIEPDLKGVKHSSSDSIVAPFSPAGWDELTFQAEVYNGMNKVPRVPARNFSFGTNGTDNNKDSITRTINWISDAYDINTQRWMRNVREDHSVISTEERDGQYPRRFTQQNTATITYQNVETIRGEYSKDRALSKQGVQDASSYQHALFSTDKMLNKFEFPIKSGFYLNPAGKYKVTVKSEIYKDSNHYSLGNTTAEHREIVDKVKKSFKYESNIVYTKDFRSTNYFMNYGQSNNILNSLVSVVPSTESDHEKLEVSTGPNDSTLDKRYKEILEGWPESNTEESLKDYNYVEYIKDGNLKIYKVTETTEITFNVNPGHNRCYISPNLPNSKTQSDYYVRSWFDPITLNLKKDENGDKGQLTTNKVNLKDNSVNIIVMGSFYDQ
ncbi:MAG: hypothetical protein N2645_05505 [Clostridia bacterium]|nr:hypothetical protein [Clostridia bacterium]